MLGTSIVIISKNFKGAMPSANGHAAGPSNEELPEDQNPHVLLQASTVLSADRLLTGRGSCHLLGIFPECWCISSNPEALHASSTAKADAPSETAEASG